MAYNKELDGAISLAVSKWGASRRKMFGGTCHLLNGNMMCGVYKDHLILRLGEQEAAEALKRRFVSPFDITGRPMKGWVMVEGQGYQGDDLLRWLARARAFVQTLPPK